MVVRNIYLQAAVYFVFKVRMGTEEYEPPSDENLVRYNLQYSHTVHTTVYITVQSYVTCNFV